MGFRYRKSIKIAPGVKLNVGKKSVGVSVGNKYGGISVNSKTGASTRVSVPGTGISYTEKISQSKNQQIRNNIVYNQNQNQTIVHKQPVQEVEKISFYTYEEYIEYSNAQKRPDLENEKKYNLFNFLFPIPSIVAIIFFGLLFAFSKTTEGNMTFGLWIVCMIIACVFIVLPLDIALYFSDMSSRKDKRKKWTEKLLRETEILFNFINTTLDEDVFFLAYEKMISIYEELVEYEKCGYFKNNLPSNSLIEIKRNREYFHGKFLERLSLYKSKNKIDFMTGIEFENYCSELLSKNGFLNVELTKASGDHGIDILAEKDDISYAIQCKCYSSNIGNSAIQQAHTGKSLYHKDVAVVITNQFFTNQAKEEAKSLGVKLWDRDKLQELMEKSI